MLFKYGKYDYTKSPEENQKESMKRYLQWKIKISIKFYNWAYPITKIIRWRINLTIRLYNKYFLDPEEDPIPQLK